MTLVSKIITNAYRQSNIIAIGTQPTADQYVEGIDYINRLVSSVLGNEAGENFQSFALGGNNISEPSGFPWYGDTPDNGAWFVPKNQRLMCNLTQDAIAPLHPMPDDGTRIGVIDSSGNFSTNSLTLLGNGRTIEGQFSVVLTDDNTDRQWFYRADLGDWRRVLPLISTDEFPFPSEFDDMFITMMAIRLNPSYEQQTDPQILAAYRRSATQFRARYKQSIQMPSEDGLLRLSKMAADRWNWWNYGWGYANPTQMFNKGVPW